MTPEIRKLRDQVVVDSKKRVVTFTLDAVDSALILDFVTRILPVERGISVVIGTGETFNPPVSEYALRVRFHGRYFPVQVSKIACGSFTLRVDGSPATRNRMILESATCILKTLNEHSMNAIITGDLGIDNEINVFIRGFADSHGGLSRVWALVETASDGWTVYPHFESELTEKAVADLLNRQHLAWDEATQTGVIRNGDSVP